MTAVPKKRKNEPGSDKAAEDERGKGYTLRKWLKKEEERIFCYIMVFYWICGWAECAALVKCREYNVKYVLVCVLLLSRYDQFPLKRS